MGKAQQSRSGMFCLSLLLILRWRMKAKYMFEIMDLDDGLVAVPVGGDAYQFNGVLKVNETAVAILKLLEKETSEDEIVSELLKEYTGDPSQIRAFVDEYLEKLKTEGVVE